MDKKSFNTCFCYLFLWGAMLSACQPRAISTVEPEPIHQTPTSQTPSLEESDVQPTPSPSKTHTFTTTLKATSTSTPTATPVYPLQPGDPLPSLKPIASDSAPDLTHIAYWGRGRITRAVYAPDGSTIAVASALGIHLYQGSTLQDAGFLRTRKEITSLCYDVSGEVLVAGARDGTLQVWDAGTNSLLDAMAHPQGESGIFGATITDLAAAPIESHMASINQDGLIVIWDLVSSRMLRTLSQARYGDCNRLAFTPDGAILVSTSEQGEIFLWDVAQGEVLRTIEHPDVEGMTGLKVYITDVAISPDGQVLASGGYDGRVYLWKITDGQRIGVLDTETGLVNSIDFAANNETIAVLGYGGDVRIWRYPESELLSEMTKVDRPLASYEAFYSSGLSFSPGGSTLLLHSEQFVELWDVSTQTRTHWVSHTSPIASMAFSEDQAWLVSGDRFGGTRVWYLADGGSQTLYYEQPGGEVGSAGDVAFFPIDNSVAAYWKGGDVIQFWNFGTWAQKYQISVDVELLSPLTFSPDRQWLAGSAFDYGMCGLGIWSREGGEPTHFIEGALMSAPAFSPDSQYLAGNVGEETWIYEVRSGEHLFSLPSGESHSLSYSHDGSLLAIGGYNAVEIWNLADKTQTMTLLHREKQTPTEMTPFVSPEEMHGFVQASFSPDDQILATGGSEGELKLWMVSDGSLLANIELQPYAERFPNYYTGEEMPGINQLDFAKNGEILFVACEDGAIWLFGIPQ